MQKLIYKNIGIVKIYLLNYKLHKQNARNEVKKR